MNRLLAVSVVTAIAICVSGCKDDHDHNAKPAQTGSQSQAAPAAGSANAPEKDDHKGEKKDLGSKEVAGYTVKTTQVGDVKAGEEAIFLLNLTGGQGKPNAIRAWVGIESAEGSTKGKCEDEEKEWHAHVEVPKPIPAKSLLWLEVETDAGKKKVAFEYKK